MNTESNYSNTKDFEPFRGKEDVFGRTKILLYALQAMVRKGGDDLAKHTLDSAFGGSLVSARLVDVKGRPVILTDLAFTLVGGRRDSEAESPLGSKMTAYRFLQSIDGDGGVIARAGVLAKPSGFLRRINASESFEQPLAKRTLVQVLDSKSRIESLGDREKLSDRLLLGQASLAKGLFGDSHGPVLESLWPGVERDQPEREKPIEQRRLTQTAKDPDARDKIRAAAARMALKESLERPTHKNDVAMTKTTKKRDDGREI